jgi:predicted DNA-binding transcriptional regulator AlpA
MIEDSPGAAQAAVIGKENFHKEKSRRRPVFSAHGTISRGRVSIQKIGLHMNSTVTAISGNSASAHMNDLYLTGPQVNKRFSISAMTRWRWEKSPQLEFPAPLKINQRSYWLLASLQHWERNRPSKSVATLSVTTQTQETL